MSLKYDLEIYNYRGIFDSLSALFSLFLSTVL